MTASNLRWAPCRGCGRDCAIISEKIIPRMYCSWACALDDDPARHEARNAYIVNAMMVSGSTQASMQRLFGLTRPAIQQIVSGKWSPPGGAARQGSPRSR